MKHSQSKSVLEVSIKIGMDENAKCFEFSSEWAQEPISLKIDHRLVSDSESKNQDDQDQIKSQDKTESQDQAEPKELPIVVRAIGKTSEVAPSDQPLSPPSQDQIKNQDKTEGKDEFERTKPRIVVRTVRKATEATPNDQPLSPPSQDKVKNQDKTEGQDDSEPTKPLIVVKAIRKATEATPDDQPLSPPSQEKIKNQDKTEGQDESEPTQPLTVVKAIGKSTETTPDDQPLSPPSQDQIKNQDKSREVEINPKEEEVNTPSAEDEIQVVPQEKNLTTPEENDTPAVNPIPEVKQEIHEVSAYESRIQGEFETRATSQETTADRLFLHLSWREKDLYGSWSTLNGEFHISPIKELLKMIIGPMAAMPGAKAIARNRIKSFYTQRAEKYAVLPEVFGVYLLKCQGRIAAKLVHTGKVVEELTVDELVKEFGG